MTLETYYLGSLSLAATLLCFIFAVLFIFGIWLFIRLRKIFNKVDTLTNTTIGMTANVNDLVHTTTARINALERLFLSAQGIKNVVEYFIATFQKKSGPVNMDRDLEPQERRNHDGRSD